MVSFISNLAARVVHIINVNAKGVVRFLFMKCSAPIVRCLGRLVRMNLLTSSHKGAGPMNNLTVFNRLHLELREFSIFRKTTPHLYVHEVVMLVTAEGQEFGTARIMRIERVSLWEKSNYNCPKCACQGHYGIKFVAKESGDGKAKNEQQGAGADGSAGKLHSGDMARKS